MPQFDDLTVDEGRVKPEYTRKFDISIPRQIGATGGGEGFSVTKIRNYNFKVVHLQTGRQFLCHSNGTTHVWWADEIVFEQKKNGVREPRKVSTPCVSYQSLNDLTGRVLKTYIEAVLLEKQRVEKKRKAEEERRAEIVRQIRLNANVELIEIPRKGDVPEYRVVEERADRMVFQGPGGVADRYAVILMNGTLGGFKDGWGIIHIGETDMLGFGFAKRDDAARELSYLLLAPELGLRWLVDPVFDVDVLQRGDGSFHIRWILSTGAEWAEDVIDDDGDDSRVLDVMSIVSRSVSRPVVRDGSTENFSLRIRNLRVKSKDPTQKLAQRIAELETLPFVQNLITETVDN